jgi:hypothetical protein
VKAGMHSLTLRIQAVEESAIVEPSYETYEAWISTNFWPISAGLFVFTVILLLASMETKDGHADLLLSWQL